MLDIVSKPLLWTAFLMANVGWSLQAAPQSEEQSSAATRSEPFIEEIVVPQRA